MAYVQLYELLPDVAMKETRTITAFEPNAFNVPPGEYGLVEMYCNDEACDCQRVFLAVISSVTQKPVAVITFGWESRQFYSKWFNRGENIAFSAMNPLDQEAVNYMYGIHLSEADCQSPIAQAILRMVTDQALNDKAYVDRLKQHYKLFREKVDENYRNKNVINFPGRKPK